MAAPLTTSEPHPAPRRFWSDYWSRPRDGSPISCRSSCSIRDWSRPGTGFCTPRSFGVSLSGLIPENPFFAGEPLKYYWFFHWMGAQVSRVFGVDPLTALRFLALAGLVLLTLAAGLVGRRVYGSLGAGLLIGVFAFAGPIPWGRPSLSGVIWSNTVSSSSAPCIRPSFRRST